MFKEKEFSAQIVLFSNISSFCSKDIVRKERKSDKADSEPFGRQVSNDQIATASVWKHNKGRNDVELTRRKGQMTKGLRKGRQN